MIWAANEGNNDALDLLIRAGAKLDLQDNYGETALMKAARSRESRRRKAVETLMKAGANPFLKTKDGKTLQEFISDDEGLTSMLREYIASMDISTLKKMTEKAGIGAEEVINSNLQDSLRSCDKKQQENCLKNIWLFRNNASPKSFLIKEAKKLHAEAHERADCEGGK
ncbi:MAG: ankyrin repeat domain-containing protein [Candidatus Anstonellales archaeon]